MAGRPPKPTALKLLAGNPGKRPLPKDEPKPRVVRPRAPSWLCAAAKREWRKMAESGFRLGVITEWDHAVLATYCQATADVERLTVKVRETGGEVVDGKRNPWTMALREAHDRLNKASQQLGFTPVSRPRVHAQKKNESADKIDPGRWFNR